MTETRLCINTNIYKLAFINISLLEVIATELGTLLLLKYGSANLEKMSVIF